MAKERMVTRKVIESKEYNVYKMEGTQLTLIGTKTAKGKLSERELAKEYGVDKVVIDCIGEKKLTYGMPVDEFMQYATLIEDTENTETESE